MTELTEYSEYIKLARSEGMSVIKIHADWCGPCKMMDKIVEDISKEYKTIQFYSIDNEDLPEVIKELGIVALPAFVFTKGKIQSVYTGAVPKIMFRTMVDNLLNL
jgi:thioredoxin 1